MFNVNASSSFFFINWLRKNLGATINQGFVSKGSLFLFVEPFWLLFILNFLSLQTNCQFRVLSDLCVVDIPQRISRFEIIYQLVSLRYSRYLCVRTSVKSFGVVPSVVCLFQAAGWYEREAFDLFGVLFSGHPDLRRLLTDYGFDGHPLRKDFPLSGFCDLRYDISKKQIITEPLEFSQSFRYFIFTNAKQLTNPAISIFYKNLLCTAGLSKLTFLF